MKKSFKIESDCQDIVKRLKDIDINYFVVYNLDKQRFELHNSAQKNSYCLTFPYESLDERAIDLALKTRVQNADIIFASLEKENKILRQKQMKQILNDFEEKIYDS